MMKKLGLANDLIRYAGRFIVGSHIVSRGLYTLLANSLIWLDLDLYRDNGFIAVFLVFDLVEGVRLIFVLWCLFFQDCCVFEITPSAQ